MNPKRKMQHRKSKPKRTRRGRPVVNAEPRYDHHPLPFSEKRLQKEIDAAREAVAALTALASEVTQ